jgi:hypothetical protein
MCEPRDSTSGLPAKTGLYDNDGATPPFGLATYFNVNAAQAMIHINLESKA